MAQKKKNPTGLTAGSHLEAAIAEVSRPRTKGNATPPAASSSEHDPAFQKAMGKIVDNAGQITEPPAADFLPIDVRRLIDPQLALAFDNRFEEHLEALGQIEFTSSKPMDARITSLEKISNVVRGRACASDSLASLDYSHFPITPSTSRGSQKDFSGSWSKINFPKVTSSKPVVLTGDFNQAFGIVLASEGGFANNKADRGGATIYGIASVHNPSEYKTIMAQLNAGDKEGAMQTTMKTYKAKYWDSVKGLEGLSPAAKLVAFDASVNHGPKFSERMIAHVGDNPEEMLSYRASAYQRIINSDPSQAVFSKGWGNRLGKLASVSSSQQGLPSPSPA
ncbi:MAG: hypothetical protein JNN09_02190 [Alphaproteobacteria bacterium]|nr:hypothetical protein [Alphaproteobacteria bacterium]